MKRKILRIIRKLFAGILFLIITLIIVGYVYEHISRSISENKYKPAGDFVDVGGHKLHYLRKGDREPTVVFESGSGAIGHLAWFKVEDEVSKFATTVSYDRAGILWSERGDNPKTADAIATELYTMLNNAGLKKPYVIVGAFVVGMLLTPPDIISQTMLAIPMLLLFEIGIIIAALYAKTSKDDDIEPTIEPKV